MEEKALDTIKEYNMLSQGDTVAVGVSGGLCDLYAVFRSAREGGQTNQRMVAK